jgi:hypothetical protein
MAGLVVAIPAIIELVLLGISHPLPLRESVDAQAIGGFKCESL